MPEVVRKLPKPAPAPEPAHQPGVDMMPVVEAMERQTVALVDVLSNALKKESTEQAKRWVFTIVRNPRTGDLEKVHGQSVTGSGTEGDPWGPGA